MTYLSINNKQSIVARHGVYIRTKAFSVFSEKGTGAPPVSLYRRNPRSSPAAGNRIAVKSHEQSSTLDGHTKSSGSEASACHSDVHVLVDPAKAKLKHFSQVQSLLCRIFVLSLEHVKHTWC